MKKFPLSLILSVFVAAKLWAVEQTPKKVKDLKLDVPMESSPGTVEVPKKIYEGKADKPSRDDSMERKVTISSDKPGMQVEKLPSENAFPVKQPLGRPVDPRRGDQRPR